MGYGVVLQPPWMVRRHLGMVPCLEAAPGTGPGIALRERTVPSCAYEEPVSVGMRSGSDASTAHSGSLLRETMQGPEGWRGPHLQGCWGHQASNTAPAPEGFCPCVKARPAGVSSGPLSVADTPPLGSFLTGPRTQVSLGGCVRCRSEQGSTVRRG